MATDGVRRAAASSSSKKQQQQQPSPGPFDDLMSFLWGSVNKATAYARADDTGAQQLP